MKNWIFLFLLFLLGSHHSFSQLNNVPDIELTDIEKGIIDFDVLRIKLLESGFYLDKKEENTYDYVLKEFWKREVSKNDNTSYGFQISKIPYDKTRYLNVIAIGGWGEDSKDFSNKLSPQIKNMFETKKVENLKYELLGKTREEYQLVYSTQRNNIKVTFEDNDESFKFVFKIFYPR
jgi:hypothetical protein